MGNTQYNPSLLDQGLAVGRGTTQKPLSNCVAQGQPSGSDLYISSTAGLAEYATVVTTYTRPVNTDAMDTEANRVVVKLDPGNLVALSGALHNGAATDIGAELQLWRVTERITPTGITYQRFFVGVVALRASGIDADAVAGIPSAPGAGWQHIDSITVEIDETLGGNGLRVMGTGAKAELVFDFVGNGWIELCGNCAASTADTADGATDCDGIWLESRIL